MVEVMGVGGMCVSTLARIIDGRFITQLRRLLIIAWKYQSSRESRQPQFGVPRAPSSSKFTGGIGFVSRNMTTPKYCTTGLVHLVNTSGRNLFRLPSNSSAFLAFCVEAPPRPIFYSAYHISLICIPMRWPRIIAEKQISSAPNGGRKFGIKRLLLRTPRTRNKPGRLIEGTKI